MQESGRSGLIQTGWRIGHKRAAASQLAIRALAVGAGTICIWPRLERAAMGARAEWIIRPQPRKLFGTRILMPFLRPSAMALSRQFAPVLRRYSSLPRLIALFIRSSADRGRERYRRVGLTAFTSYIARGLTIVMGFVSVPLTIDYLGAERYGVWLTISSLLLWLALTDFGLAGNALVNVLSEAIGKDDREAARHYAASAFWALVAITLGIGIVFMGAFSSIPWRAVFRVSDATSTQELETTCALVLALFVINLPLSLLKSLYNAHQDGYLANFWWIVSGVVSLLGLVIVTRFQGGLPQLVFAISGVPTLVLLANAYHVFVRRYPWLTPAPSAVRWSCISRLLKLGGKYMVVQLASLGIYQSQAMIITQMIGPPQVVIFVVTYKVVTLPVEMAYMGTVPFVSAFGEARARRDWSWIKGAYKNATLASIGLGLPLAAALALLAKPLIVVWAGPSAVPDPYLVLWLFIYTAVGVCLMTAGQFLSGLQRLDPLALSITLCSIGCVVLGVVFAPWWGLSGIAFAMAISKIATFWPIQLRAVRRIFRAATAASGPQHAA
jgi:O-antigen/teichoic acid export membrane protein